MKALGLIEVRGMVPAVEALDSALKAANVNRLDVVKVGGGLVSVLIEGDVGAGPCSSRCCTGSGRKDWNRDLHTRDSQTGRGCDTDDHAEP